MLVQQAREVLEEFQQAQGSSTNAQELGRENDIIVVRTLFIYYASDVNYFVMFYHFFLSYLSGW